MSNIVIPDGGNIGSASDPDALAISSSGIVTMASGNGYRFAGMQVFTSTGTSTSTSLIISRTSGSLSCGYQVASQYVEAIGISHLQVFNSMQIGSVQLT